MGVLRVVSTEAKPKAMVFDVVDVVTCTQP
jgi:hypothetical protein